MQIVAVRRRTCWLDCSGRGKADNRVLGRRGKFVASAPHCSENNSEETHKATANLAGYVKDEDYAKGNVEAARKAWKPLADNMGMSVEEAAKEALRLSAVKNGKVVKALIEDYNMDPRTIVLVGGGGGAAAVVPHLAETLSMKHRNAKNASVISTIGVALAMIRDTVEIGRASCRERV